MNINMKLINDKWVCVINQLYIVDNDGVRVVRDDMPLNNDGNRIQELKDHESIVECIEDIQKLNLKELKSPVFEVDSYKIKHMLHKDYSHGVVVIALYSLFEGRCKIGRYSKDSKIKKNKIEEIELEDMEKTSLSLFFNFSSKSIKKAKEG